jgi:hypothetical protein
LQGHVAGALGGPFVGLFQQDGAGQADGGGLVGKDADDISAPLNFAIEALDGVGRVELSAVCGGKGYVGQDVLLGAFHEGGKLRDLGAELVGDGAPLGMR